MPSAFTMIMAVTLAFAVTTDLRHRRISNRLTLPAAMLGVFLHTYAGGLEGLRMSAAGWFIAVAVLLVPFALRWLGAGDVKLVAAVGALQGPQFVLMTCLLTALFGGLMAIGALGQMGKVRLALMHLLFAWRMPASPDLEALVRHKIPYAPAIAMGAVASLLFFS